MVFRKAPRVFVRPLWPNLYVVAPASVNQILGPDCLTPQPPHAPHGSLACVFLSGHTCFRLGFDAQPVFWDLSPRSGGPFQTTELLPPLSPSVRGAPPANRDHWTNGGYGPSYPRR